MERCDNPIIREKVLELLKTLREAPRMGGFRPDADNQIINKIVGLNNPSQFRFFYNHCADFPEWSKVAGLEESDFPLDKRVKEFLAYLEPIIEKYESRVEELNEDSAERERLESKCAVIPEAHRLDRLLRYSAAFNRDFDRTLNQLERLQRIRKGQPVPPTLNVNLSR